MIFPTTCLQLGTRWKYCMGMLHLSHRLFVDSSCYCYIASGSLGAGLFVFWLALVLAVVVFGYLSISSGIFLSGR